MTRIAVKIKWNGQAFSAYDPNTGNPIPNYSNLSYGKVDTGIDDPLTSILTFTVASRVLASKVVDTTAILDGWVTVP